VVLPGKHGAKGENGFPCFLFGWMIYAAIDFSENSRAFSNGN
jgi:hypothetical protein